MKNITVPSVPRSERRPPLVYQRIADVSAALAKTGVAKNRENAQQHYSFRGIDDLYNALGPLLAANHLVIIPRIVSRDVTERKSSKGQSLFFVVVKAEFTFVATEDGSTCVAQTYGEAFDTADKATNKAISAAYKYLVIPTFCIPVQGEPDADQDSAEVAPKPPEGYDDWLTDLEATADTGIDALKEAWDQSSGTFRSFLVTTDKAKWEALKAKAAAV